jgi:hypothetical protein
MPAPGKKNEMKGMEQRENNKNTQIKYDKKGGRAERGESQGNRAPPRALRCGRPSGRSSSRSARSSARTCLAVNRRVRGPEKYESPLFAGVSEGENKREERVGFPHRETTKGQISSDERPHAPSAREGFGQTRSGPPRLPPQGRRPRQNQPLGAGTRPPWGLREELRKNAHDASICAAMARKVETNSLLFRTQNTKSNTKLLSSTAKN